MKPIKLILSLVMGVMLVTQSGYAQNSQVQNIAGQLYLGYSGDGGPAINAQLHLPGEILVDVTGNVYFSDYLNGRIRKIDASTGIITTIAGNGTDGLSGDGGPATNAQFHMANAIALDTMGNMYVCDQLNWRIRKIDPNGIITTIAGVNVWGLSGDGGLAINANFQNPREVSVDLAGNIYVGDDARIRKIDIQTGIINTIVGTGNFGNSGDGGLATAADVGEVRNIVFDAAGDLYFTNSYPEHVVRKVNMNTGIITTVAGNGMAGDSGDGGPAFAAQINNPSGLSFDATGNLYISQSGKIRRVDAGTGFISTFLDTVNAASMGFDLYGNLYFGHCCEGYIQKLQSSTPVININSNNFSVQAYYQCNGPNFTAICPQYNPDYSLKTFYGDGSNDTHGFANGNGQGAYTLFNHSYSSSGYYTIKHVLYDNNAAIDSISYPFQYSMCRTIPVQFYVDDNSDCTYDPMIDVPVVLSVSVQVDSNGIAIDTFNVLGGFYYYAKGNVGDIYTFTPISWPDGLTPTCPQNGIISDTLETVVYSLQTKNIGFDCGAPTNVFDLGVTAVFQTGIHAGMIDIVVTNPYCHAQNATLTMNLSPSHYIFDDSYPPPFSQNGNVVTWNLNGVSTLISDPVYIHATLSTLGILNIGDTFTSAFNLTPTVGDIDLTNNFIVQTDTVKGSFDPNAIYVSPNTCVSAGTNLKYTITFENIGNAPAINIHVLDTIPNTLDIKSVEIINSSHTMMVSEISVAGYNILRFDFPNIMLPDSSHHNECHGMLQYEINSDAALPFGTQIENRAGIYFDANDVVLTNTALTEICWPASVNTVAKTDDIRIYPNPVTGNELTILTEQAYTSYIITNSIGQELMKSTLYSKDTKVNIKSLATGIYYITLKGDKGTVVKKFVKL